ncbi:XRE family transcriptional regulator [Bryocella elongata]|uniref:XRE family transcriptional regulator n=1 Tax=Bryocella elongata TaxID=863522 RepID=UPI001F40F26D|nr:XRE family transcriptional regulator [Bryocella elongata]
MREVEERTQRLAQQWNNPAYRISASWLDRVERENRDLSAMKLIVLAAVYGLNPDQMLALCPPSPPAESVEPVSSPNATLLLSEGPLNDHARAWLPDTLVTETPPAETMLLPSENGNGSSPLRRGVVGQRDRTLEPMIRPGSIVLIDTQKRAIAHRREWTSEFDRPIYFLLTRDGYVTGFCELDKESTWLTLVPHPLSYESSRRWKYRKEIEVIGTVTGVALRRVS